MAIKIYQGNVTAGGVDGDALSMGDYTAPLHFDLDAQLGDEQIATLAVRCDTNFQTRGECKIFDSGDTVDRYQLSINGTSWADAITFGGVSEVNSIFYAKSRTIGAEYSHLDRQTKFVIDCVLERV